MKTLTAITLIAAAIAGAATADATPEASEVEELINGLTAARAAFARFEPFLNWYFLIKLERVAVETIRDDVEIPSIGIISDGPANLI